MISSSFTEGRFPYFSRRVLGDRLAKREIGGKREREREREREDKEIETDLETERHRVRD